MINRKATIEVPIRDKVIGGNNPILIQSMTNTKTSDIESTVKQIHELEDAGVDIVRFAVTDDASAKAIKEIKDQTSVPLVADIQFDYKLALKSLENGIDKLRINPGNIGTIDKIEAVVRSAAEKNIPIRIGVNSGSIEKDLLEKYGPTPKALVESAARHVKILEDLNFYNTIIAIKASSVNDTIEANRLLSEKFNYPLHLGVTEAGIPKSGIIKSAIGIGSLLYDGIGDTIRVSLTGDPVEEVRVAQEILRDLGLEQSTSRPEIVACPTCARTNIDLIKIANEVEEKVKDLKKDIKIAVMGCVVNGPGEARNADIGIAGGNGRAALFKKGKVIKEVSEDNIVEALMEEIEKTE